MYENNVSKLRKDTSGFDEILILVLLVMQPDFSRKHEHEYMHDTSIRY